MKIEELSKDLREVYEKIEGFIKMEVGFEEIMNYMDEKGYSVLRSYTMPEQHMMADTFESFDLNKCGVTDSEMEFRIRIVDVINKIMDEDYGVSRLAKFKQGDIIGFIDNPEFLTYIVEGAVRKDCSYLLREFNEDVFYDDIAEINYKYKKIGEITDKSLLRR